MPAGLHPVGPAAHPVALAEYTRGPCVESVHLGYLEVFSAAGERLLSLGDSPHIFPRSAVKPMQALPTVSRGAAAQFDLRREHLAIMCASHAAQPFHQQAVREILERVGASEADLYCGPHAIPDRETAEALIRAGGQPTRLHNNCSGKHAGMLALARLLGEPPAGYWEPTGAVQREIQRAFGVLIGRPADSFQWGVDGCGVPTYLLEVRELALGFARLANPETLPAPEADGARQICAAMTAKPEYVQGTGRFNTVLMEALPGQVIVKGGAEGCGAIGVLGKGLGIAAKVQDGSARALPAILLEAMARFDLLPKPLPKSLAPLRRPSVLNTRGAVVGECRVLF